MKRAVSTLAMFLACCSAGAADLKEIAATDSHIARMGRMTEEAGGAVRFAYPGVKLAFSFTGSTLSFDASSSGTKSILEAVIDGGAPQRIKIGGTRATYTLLQSKPGKHSVELMHRSETWHGVVTVDSFKTDGVLDTAPALAARKLLVLGDSVTCAEAVGERIGTKSASWHDPRHSYGMLLGDALAAQVHLVCHGGRGLVRSWNNRTDEFNLPDFYELAIADAAHPEPWDHARYQPDLIVSAIGTNDFNPGVPDAEAYVSTYVKFVQTLLRNHPQAQIVLTEGSILSGGKKAALKVYLAEVVQRVNDPRVHIATSTYYPGDAKDGHPTGPQHAAMARDLAPQLRGVMGW